MITIKTSIELSKCVSNDIENHPLKNLTDLFLSAMNDWPTIKDDLINEFIMDLKSFYSEKITIESIRSKKINFDEEFNSWRAESGYHIIELLKESNKSINETDFDLIVDQILNYYSKNNAN